MFTRTAGNCAAGIQNNRVFSVGYGMCYRSHRSVGYCGTKVTELTEVSGYCIQNQRVIFVGYRMCYRTQRSVGYL